MADYKIEFFSNVMDATACAQGMGGIMYQFGADERNTELYLSYAQKHNFLNQENEFPYCVLYVPNNPIRIAFGSVLDASADVVVHQVNCFGVMGAGLAYSIRTLFPDTYFKYKHFCNEHVARPKDLLGKVLYTQEYNYVIANAFGQFYYGRNKMQTDYEMLARCFQDIAKEYHGKRVALPYKIGCGLAGGNWSIVFSMIWEYLVYQGECKVCIYHLNSEKSSL